MQPPPLLPGYTGQQVCVWPSALNQLQATEGLQRAANLHHCGCCKTSRPASEASLEHQATVRLTCSQRPHVKASGLATGCSAVHKAARASAPWVQQPRTAAHQEVSRRRLSQGLSTQRRAGDAGGYHGKGQSLRYKNGYATTDGEGLRQARGLPLVGRTAACCPEQELPTGVRRHRRRRRATAAVGPGL